MSIVLVVEAPQPVVVEVLVPVLVFVVAQPAFFLAISSSLLQGIQVPHALFPDIRHGVVILSLRRRYHRSLTRFVEFGYRRQSIRALLRRCPHLGLHQPLPLRLGGCYCGVIDVLLVLLQSANRRVLVVVGRARPCYQGHRNSRGALGTSRFI